MNKPLLSALALVVPLAWSQGASASGFATARFGGEHGNPITSNPTAIYYNPAGIAESEGYHLFIDGNLALRGTSYTHEASTADVAEPADATGANTGKATLFNVVAAPMIGATAKFGDFALGLGAYVPFGGTAKWDKNEDFDGNKKYPGAVDGPQRWYAIDGEIQTFYFTLAAAYKIPKTGLSLGLAGNLIRSRIHTIRARNADGGNTIEDGAEGRSLIDVDGWQGSFGLGAMYEAMPKKLWFGLSYQARPNISGGMKLKGHLLNNLAGALTAEPGDEVEISQDLPDIFRLGARYAASKQVELRLFGDFTRWSSFKDQCLANAGKECNIGSDGSTPKLADGTDDPNNGAVQNLRRNWKDTFGVRAGASYWMKPEVELFGGLGYDGNAVPDETLDPALPDWNKLSVGAGGRLAIGSRMHAALSYTQLIYLSRDTGGKSELATYKTPTRGPDSGGKYTQWIGVINANLDVSF